MSSASAVSAASLISPAEDKAEAEAAAASKGFVMPLSRLESALAAAVLLAEALSVEGSVTLGRVVKPDMVSPSLPD